MKWNLFVWDRIEFLISELKIISNDEWRGTNVQTKIISSSLSAVPSLFGAPYAYFFIVYRIECS